MNKIEQSLLPIKLEPSLFEAEDYCYHAVASNRAESKSVRRLTVAAPYRLSPRPPPSEERDEDDEPRPPPDEPPRPPPPYDPPPPYEPPRLPPPP